MSMSRVIPSSWSVVRGFCLIIFGPSTGFEVFNLYDQVFQLDVKDFDLAAQFLDVFFEEEVFDGDGGFWGGEDGGFHRFSPRYLA